MWLGLAVDCALWRQFIRPICVRNYLIENFSSKYLPPLLSMRIKDLKGATEKIWNPSVLFVDFYGSLIAPFVKCYSGRTQPQNEKSKVGMRGTIRNIFLDSFSLFDCLKNKCLTLYYFDKAIRGSTRCHSEFFFLILASWNSTGNFFPTINRELACDTYLEKNRNFVPSSRFSGWL